MAESVVCFVIDKLITFLIITKAKISSDVHQEISFIRDELQSIQSFLRDADAQAAAEEETLNITNQSVTTWVNQVREAAYHIEDLIDEYFLRIIGEHEDRGCISLLRNPVSLVQKMKSKNEVASRVGGMKTLISDIKARRERYAFISTDQWTINPWRWHEAHDPRVAALFIEDAEVVGVESARDELISWIVRGGASSSSARRAVISVVGMGGLGKTTLAKKVYDSRAVIEQFDCHAWITVSQLFKMEDVLKTMIKQFYKAMKQYALEGVDPMNQESLVRKSREYLQNKRYVVVFDDVWNVDFWGAIEHALPENDKGCRIMITTRSTNVAEFCKKSCFADIHYLQPLPPNKAWELFCRKAFQFDQLEGKCPPELKELSLNLVRKCEGLPLAIVAIGGLLSTKAKVVSEWRKLYNSLSSELESNPHLSSLTRIMFLSYHHLPYYLKSCVLYFGIFPEDYSVSCARLVRLWIAEGFVKVTNGKTLEEVAEGYLTELIHRSLVQVSRVYIDGKARSCRVHDLLREVLLKKAVDSSFCHVLSKDDSTYKSNSTRRLSIDSNSDSLISISIEHSNIRAVFSFNQDEGPKKFLNTMSGNFKLLKVLDFAGAPVQHLPKCVGSLYFLRYLSVRNTKVKLLPKSIGKLQNLETLDLKQSLVCEISAKLHKLLKLRYILACYSDYDTDFSMSFEQGVKIKDDVGCLSAMQKLYHVDANYGGISLIQALGKLRQLRKLGLKNLKSEDGNALCASIENMDHLDSLRVCTMSEDHILHVQSMSKPPEFIRFLDLKGCLEQLPSWIPKLQHLVKLRVFWSRLSDDPLKALQNLPNLLELGLSYKAYDGVELHFAKGGFQKLKVLKLRDLEGLESVIIDSGVMPLLQELQLGPSPQMKEVPSGIHHLKNLRTLIFVDMPEIFRQGIEGQHYWLVEHVTEVLFSYKFGPKCGIYEAHKLRDTNGTTSVKLVKAYR